MRTSSIKSLVITAATVAAIAATTLPVTARPAQSTRPTQAQRETGAMATMKRLYKRFITPILNGLPVVPVPGGDKKDGSSSGATTEVTTTSQDS
jgi:hypothetical protein